MDLTVRHIYPDGKIVIRYIPEKVYNIALGILPRGHRYEIIEDIFGVENIPHATLEEVLQKMDDAELKWYAIEHGVKILNTKDREKIIKKILEHAKL
jgi:hypothetical protein